MLNIFLKILFIQVLLIRLFVKFQHYTMCGSCQIVCGGGGGVDTNYSVKL